MANSLSATPTVAGSLAASPDLPLGAAYPESDEFPSATTYPGRGTTLSATGVADTENYVPATVPFSVGTGSTFLSATPIS